MEGRKDGRRDDRVVEGKECTAGKEDGVAEERYRRVPMPCLPYRYRPSSHKPLK